MTDVFDRAQEAEAKFREQALAAHLSKAPQGESAAECARCGETIPAARRAALPGVRTCIECQEFNEQTKGRYGAN